MDGRRRSTGVLFAAILAALPALGVARAEEVPREQVRAWRDVLEGHPGPRGTEAWRARIEAARAGLASLPPGRALPLLREMLAGLAGREEAARVAARIGPAAVGLLPDLLDNMLDPHRGRSTAFVEAVAAVGAGTPARGR